MRTRRILGIVLVLACFLAVIGQAATLRLGMRGNDVLILQENLARLGYFHATPTGYYGRLTCEAVKVFQQAAGLRPDGVAGERTLAAVTRALANLAGQVTSRSSGTVSLLSWDLVNQIWPKGTTARVYDVDTGLSLAAWRLYGSLHADVEPLTKYDTYQLKRIYGGRWSWDRRAVIVELGGRYLAGSMNGMPHGREAIHNNDFPGQFCIHFLGSRLHKNRSSDPRHQAMVLKAARTGLGDLIRPADPSLSEQPPADEERGQTPGNTPEEE